MLMIPDLEMEGGCGPGQPYAVYTAYMTNSRVSERCLVLIKFPVAVINYSNKIV